MTELDKPFTDNIEISGQGNDPEPTYYLIRGEIVGKRTDETQVWSDYLFEDGKWVLDRDSVIMDREIGYDPSEPPGSPYWCGCMDVMDELEEISAAEAMALMGEQVVALLTEKWKRDFAAKKDAWNKHPGWPAKLVSTEFTLYGNKYSIRPEDIGLTDDCWDQGFMETIQSEIKRDLADYGATDIFNCGFID